MVELRRSIDAAIHFADICIYPANNRQHRHPPIRPLGDVALHPIYNTTNGATNEKAAKLLDAK